MKKEMTSLLLKLENLMEFLNHVLRDTTETLLEQLPNKIALYVQVDSNVQKTL